MLTRRKSAQVSRSRTDGFTVRTSTIAVRARLGRLRGEEGTTLIELVVGMMIMSIFLVMFTGAIVTMNRAENKTEAVSITTAQVNQAFLTLDKTVRYATAISTPGTGTAGDWYVELRSTNTGSEVCTQLRIDSQQLQRRTWTVTNSVGSTPSAWVPMASSVNNGGAAAGAGQPFVLVVPVVANDTAYQQLKFNLSTLAGAAGSQTPSLSSFTFTATNSTLPAPAAPVCQEQGRP